VEYVVLGLIVVALLFFFALGITAMVAKFYRKVDQGKALIINKMKKDPEVVFTGGVVIPVIHRAEVMDISVKTIEIARAGKDGLICADNIRADIKVTFFVRVNKTIPDVLKVAQAIGCQRASDQQTLEELFVAKFSEALKTVGKKLEFEQLYTQRDDFKDQIIQVIGRDLNGYNLEDAAIDYLEQTPLVALDKDNILDSQGIRKITEMTAQQNLLTNDLRQNERKEVTRQNLEADEAILELERRRADAEAKQRREIATVEARESAETKKVQAEETQRAEVARIKSEEEVQISTLNKQRQVEVADKDRERVVAIKSEQVERDRQVEIISREREVERQRIDKEMELEVKRKEIAEVVRTRIVVDKNVAEEEERIKDLRAHADAERKKTVSIIAAQGEAEEALVKDIKQAEANEKVAEFAAREKLTLANADLEAADRVAKGKTRMAEGVQAEEAAHGLAKVRVEEANAVALQKTGLAEARVALEKMQAEAKGTEEIGLAKMIVREREVDLEAKLMRENMVAAADGKQADAVAIEKLGLAEAASVRAKLTAQADGDTAGAAALRERLLAEASGTEAMGLAEAKAVQEKMQAEAAGLRAKLEAMQAMEGAARQHEEFRIRLDHERELGLQAIATQQKIAEAQARLLGEAFGNADIKIMGGDGQFLDKFVQAASLGSAVDGFVGHSASVKQLVAPYIAGERDAGSDLASLVSSIAPNAESMQGMALTAVLGKLLLDTKDDDKRSRLSALLEKAEELGL
jgi:uncharacterized membrane protein YqiK